MNAGLVSVVWALVALDCALMGYRLSMGRSRLLDKRRLHQRASVRAGMLALPGLAAVTVVAVAAVAQAGGSAGADLDAAMVRFIVVGGVYAALILGAAATCVLPSVTVRAAASVVIFGPLTLLRPFVVVLAVGAALGPHPPAWLMAVGLLVAVPGLLIEPVLDRRVARSLLRQGATEP